MIKTKVTSLFTFGLFLLVAGIISKFFDWQQANLVMAIGLVFEMLAAIIYSYQKLRK